MLVNVGIEALARSIPVVGDLFDIAFKANRRNYQVMKRHLSHSQRQTTRDWVFLIMTVVMAAATIALPVIALIELARHIAFR